MGQNTTVERVEGDLAKGFVKGLFAIALVALGGFFGDYFAQGEEKESEKPIEQVNEKMAVLIDKVDRIEKLVEEYGPTLIRVDTRLTAHLEGHK